MYKSCLKRLLDVILSFTAIIILSPVFMIVSLIVKFGIGSPILFTQQRPGKDEKIFTLYKFRSMSNQCDENGNLLPDYKRLGKTGKALRASSLDELPELWNILKGDMSIVGPRPLLVEYLEIYDERQKHRHDVRPGLTGLAQVNGRNCISWDEKFNYDLQYISNISFRRDAAIILKTIKLVFLRSNIHSETAVTMERFEKKEKRLVIIGAGGHGKVVYEIANQQKIYSEIVFLDDKWAENIKTNRDIKILGKTDKVYSMLSNYDVFVAIGNNESRKRFVLELEKKNATLPTLIHPNATVSQTAKLGKGTVVMAGAIINAGSQIGTGCIINTGSIIEHDNMIKGFAHISPNVSLGGTVKVGQGVHIGIGATIKNNVNICNDCKIGAGAVVIKDILNKGTYVGVPVNKLDI